MGLISHIIRVKRVKPENLGKFRNASKFLFLNGAHEPFWRDWKFADPCQFLAPDALHQWYKFFWMHPVNWARTLMTDEEMGRRFASLQKIVGKRHFPDSFSHFGSQITLREQRDIASHFLSLLPSSELITQGCLRAFRALLDFFYIAQFETQTTESLVCLDMALHRFHVHKKALSDAGVRDGLKMNGDFHIPKIELMQHVSRLARLIGSGIQYSMEHTERCHIPMAKKPYRSSNKKDHPEQVCRHLDRHNKIHRFTEYQEWVSLELDVAPPSGAALIPAATAHREKNLALFTKKFLPESVRNAFDDDECPHNSTTAFILTSKATALNCSIDECCNSIQNS